MIKFNDLIFVKHDAFKNAKKCRINFVNDEYVSIIAALDKNKQSHVYGDGKETFELWTSEKSKANQDIEAYISSERINEVLKEYQLKYGKPIDINDIPLEDFSNNEF
jgi:hypothetical protein